MTDIRKFDKYVSVVRTGRSNWYRIYLSVGVQSFPLWYDGQKCEAYGYATMLKHALRRMVDDETKRYTKQKVRQVRRVVRGPVRAETGKGA